LVATETQQEIAPGVTYAVWTFGDQAPGPTLRVRQGDTIQFTLRNGGQVAHSIDFHAAQTPWDQNYHSVNPGETISFTWQANYPGAFLYHCGTAPALMHIANGMYGAVIVDPAEPLLPAKEFVLVQSEFYAQPAADRTRNEGDYAKMLADAPDFVVFNGVAQQYMQHPLQADPGERLRFWVVNAGPSQPSAFHVVGAILDRVYPDGNPANAWQGMQTYNIPPGGGAMVELTVPDEGLYPIVSHSFASATKGALAMLRVGNPPGAPEAASH
jgi:nitrite reductase (NO-forming)